MMLMKMMTMTFNFVDVISVGDILCGDRKEQFASDSLRIKREQVFRFPAQSTSRPLLLRCHKDNGHGHWKPY